MKAKLFILIFCASLLSSCVGDDFSKNKISVCPTVNDPISWKNGIVKYGQWQFGYTWMDGNFGIGTGGVQVINLHNDCGCQFNGTETGGSGNTYAVYLTSGVSKAVIYRWKYNTFCELEVFDTWQGTTEKSVRMNCLLSDFLQKYPGDFSVNANDSTQYDAFYASGITVKAWFTQKEADLGKLKELKISAQ
jgi:hypothetical protein